MVFGISDSDKNDIWKKIAEISKKQEKQNEHLEVLEKKIPETFLESKQANKKTSEYRNKAKKSLEVAIENENKITEVQSKLFSIYSDVEMKHLQFNELITESDSQSKSIAEHYSNLNKAKEASEPLLVSLEELLSEKSRLEVKVEQIISLYDDVVGMEKKSRLLLSQMAVTKNSTKEMHDSIFGYNTPGDSEGSGESVRVEGLKEKLDDSYLEIESKIDLLTDSFDDFEKNANKDVQKLHNDANDKYEKYLSDCNDTFSGVVTKLKGLLPEALTAGLASAYEKKTSTELVELTNHKKTFNRSIFGLVFISILPFAINTVRLIKNPELEILNLIKDMPYLVFSMMPLYIPVLWIAYSANKSYKLSKRLIEEYSHKGVVSRTFEGLANQISEIESSELSIELRTQLLFNLISVNSENPGKLISDYNKSDHPLMDALDKSSQMASSLAKLAKIPGFSKMAKNLSDKGQKILDIESKKVAVVLEETENERSQNS
ncbi:MAG: hypothetical protein COB38_08755 [Gammaproteobacteria bacterium]|nr:MAG: hypothetical protein COB38_08755 [Gammaproteobacteria bacterium]